MENNRLKPEDRVKVAVYDSDAKELGSCTISGVHDIAEAIDKAWKKMKIVGDPKDFVFNVSNLTEGTARRYRLNAHGNVKLIAEVL